MKKLFILMFLLSPVHAAETVASVKERLVKGELKASEITGNKKDWKLCFTCNICKDKSFQRFYIRFLSVQKKDNNNNNKNKYYEQNKSRNNDETSTYDLP